MSEKIRFSSHDLPVRKAGRFARQTPGIHYSGRVETKAGLSKTRPPVLAFSHSSFSSLLPSPLTLSTAPSSLFLTFCDSFLILCRFRSLEIEGEKSQMALSRFLFFFFDIG